jgi:hypothetical protein
MFREFAVASLNKHDVEVIVDVEAKKEKSVAELIGAVVDRRLSKIEALRTLLRRAISRMLMIGRGGGGPPAVHDANGADAVGEAMRSPVTRLDGMQLVLVGASNYSMP